VSGTARFRAKTTFFLFSSNFLDIFFPVRYTVLVLREFLYQEVMYGKDYSFKEHCEEYCKEYWYEKNKHKNAEFDVRGGAVA
jgi:hypothetical protein